MTPQTQPVFCSECGQSAGLDELARFGDRLVCPNCKNRYAQRLREGVAPAGFIRYGGFWLRFLAVIIDGIIIAIPLGILQAMLFAATRLSMTQIAQTRTRVPKRSSRRWLPRSA